MAVCHFAGGVAVQKYNPKTGVKSVLLRGGSSPTWQSHRPSLRHCEKRSDVAISMLIKK